MLKLPLQNHLGKLLKATRKARFLTQRLLARKARLSIPTIGLLEQGRGNLTSWQKSLSALDVELKGRNLPQAETLGKQIAALRKRRNLGQRVLALWVRVIFP